MSTLVTECSTMPVLRKLGIEAGSANKMLKVKATATNVNSARTWSRPNRSVPYLQWNVARKDKHTIQNANKQPHTKYTHNSEMKWINQFSVIFCESIVFAFIYMLVHFFSQSDSSSFQVAVLYYDSHCHSISKPLSISLNQTSRMEHDLSCTLVI